MLGRTGLLPAATMLSRLSRLSRLLLLSLPTLALIAFPAGGQEAADTSMKSMKVEGATGTEVVERELHGESDTFAEGGRVYFFTKVSGARPGSRLLHVWYRDGEEKATVELTVGAEVWRTWSYKTMHPGSTGAWRVEAVDEAGRTLETVEFTCE